MSKAHEHDVGCYEAVSGTLLCDRPEFLPEAGRCPSCNGVSNGRPCETCLRDGLVVQVAFDVSQYLGPHVEHREQMLDRVCAIVRDVWARRLGAFVFFLLLPALAGAQDTRQSREVAREKVGRLVVSDARAESRPTAGADHWRKYLYVGLAAGVHLSAERDVRSTIHLREVCPPPYCHESNLLVKPFYRDNAKLRAAAHVGAAGVNTLSYFMLRSKRCRKAAWVPQVAAILLTNYFAHRNNVYARQQAKLMPLRRRVGE